MRTRAVSSSATRTEIGRSGFRVCIAAMQAFNIPSRYCELYEYMYVQLAARQK